MIKYSETIVAQRDYVRRGQPAPSRRKKSSSRKPQRSMPAVSPAMVAIAAAVLVAFIGGLWFITHHKKEEAEALQGNKVVGNGLPPKPEERWRYIKELESRQPGVRAPTEPSAGGEVVDPTQLTNEQRQLLAQMQADMRQQPTQLNEVPWNDRRRHSASKRCSVSVRHSSKLSSSNSGRRASRYSSLKRSRA